jgi:hypothetical protein
MRKEKTLDFGHTTVTVHEPTVGQVRNLLGRDDLDFQPIEYLSGAAEISPDLLLMVTDLTPETLKSLTLSELQETMEAAGEMLRPFFAIAEMLGTVAGYLSSTKSSAS